MTALIVATVPDVVPLSEEINRRQHVIGQHYSGKCIRFPPFLKEDQKQCGFTNHRALLIHLPSTKEN